MPLPAEAAALVAVYCAAGETVLHAQHRLQPHAIQRTYEHTALCGCQLKRAACVLVPVRQCGGSEEPGGPGWTDMEWGRHTGRAGCLRCMQQPAPCAGTVCVCQRRKYRTFHAPEHHNKYIRIHAALRAARACLASRHPWSLRGHADTSLQEQTRDALAPAG